MERYSYNYVCHRRHDKTVKEDIMQREIYVVIAHVVDANGTFNVLSGYPKTIDSRSYDNDLDKTRQRAIGVFSECVGAMCKVDTRQLQTVMLMTASGMILEHRCFGRIADLPDPEAINEPE